jgi:hypothetical protein
MMLDEIRASIYRVTEDIYKYRLNDLVGNLCSIMDSVNKLLGIDSSIERNIVNYAFKSILSALKDKDYIQVADILVYQLIPAIEIDIDNKAIINQ